MDRIAAHRKAMHGIASHGSAWHRNETQSKVKYLGQLNPMELLMKNSLDRTHNYQILENYFRLNFTQDDDFRTYAEIERACGIDIRAGFSQKNYNIFARLRDDLCLDSNPMMLEVIRGQGVQRIRIGSGAHAKADDGLAAIRRKSEKNISLVQQGRLHSIDDEEAHKNLTMGKIYAIFLSRTTRDAKNEMYSSVSNGYHPARPFVGLRNLLKGSSK